MSFNDLLEVAVIAAARRSVPMKSIRTAIDTAQELYAVDRPLLQIEFKHNGRDLFAAESLGRQKRVVNLSEHGQTAWEHIEDVLEDLDYDSSGAALRWFPTGRDRPIVIDPRISFGRPYIKGRGVSTDVIRSRFQAGESIEDVSDDLDLTPGEAEEAIRFELPLAA